MDFDMGKQGSIVIGHLTRNPESKESNPVVKVEHG